MWRKRKRGEKRRREGRFVPVLLFPHFEPCLSVCVYNVKKYETYAFLVNKTTYEKYILNIDAVVNS